MTAEFDWTWTSSCALPSWSDFRFQTLRSLLQYSSEAEANAEILAGVINERAVAVSLKELAAAHAACEAWLEQHGIKPNSRVIVVRLPYASELSVAVNALALMASGVCVVLPMNCHPHEIVDLVCRTGTRHLIMPVEPEVLQRHASTSAVYQRMCRELDECGTVPLPAPVTWPIDCEKRHQLASRRRAAEVDREAVILTTSASTGPAKLVKYRERALLTVAEAWQAAGLFDPQLLGGTSLCPLFSHSMGLRNVLHALWTRQVTLLIPPEWIDEAPHRAVDLLQRWPPQHFTGGPALIQALAELARNIPEARRTLRHLNVVVSSGSAWDSRTRHSFPRARLANAFGMTETQQVLSTLLVPTTTDAGDAAHSNVLGLPLPGVTAAVRREHVDSAAGRLFIKSAFNAIGYEGESPFEEWFDTGDCVHVVNGGLEYHGRATDDFLNLGNGLKVSLHEFEDRYSGAFREFPATLYRSSPARLGVTAVVFCGERNPECSRFQQQIRESVRSVHDQYWGKDHEFQMRHQRLVAVGLISGVPRRIGPGKIDQRALAHDHRGILDALDSATARHSRVVDIDEFSVAEAWYSRLSPYVGQLMQALKLDVEYVSGEGDDLVCKTDRGTRRVLDLVGGFGANLLGHGRRELQEVAIAALQGLPLLDQGSKRSAAVDLARALTVRIGAITGRRYVCLLHSTGAESVEAALKHALFKWRARFTTFNRELAHEFVALCPDLVNDCREHNESQIAAVRPLLLALEGGYHGKTTGALNVMSDASQRTPFDAILGARVRFVPRSALSTPQICDNDVCRDESIVLRRPVRCHNAYEVVEAPFSLIMAAIAEPIQGEGGIFVVPPEWFRAVRKAGIPLILDEIQCGLGRTGRFLASEGVDADYYLLGKSLGGGLAKISATLIDRAEYCNEFDLQTGATFSADSFSSRVAIKALELIDTDEVPARAASIGRTLSSRLAELQSNHPQVIRAVRGCGLMWGVELSLPLASNRFLRQLLGRRVGYLAASYLLHRHDIRVLPTMSAPHVLRIEPSAYLTTDGIDRLCTVIEAFCHQVESDRVADLVEHLMSPATTELTSTQHGQYLSIAAERQPFRFTHEPPDANAKRVGFVFNPIYPADELLVEMPELMGRTVAERMELVWRLQVLAEGKPFVAFSKNLFDGRVWMCGILLPMAPTTLEQMHRLDDLSFIRERLDDALRLATDQGCGSVSFGAQTSIVTRDAATLIAPDGVQVSSGNTLTAAVMIEQIERAIENEGVSRYGTLAVVGAAGNIGSAIVRWYSQCHRWPGRMTLLGRPGTRNRLEELAQQIQPHATAESILASDNRADLLDCDVIVVAVSGGVVVNPSDIRPHSPVIVADVSQPRGVSASLNRERPNAKMVTAGLVRLPADPAFRLTPHTPPGKCFACAAEAVLMGLETVDYPLRGSIDLDAVEMMQRFAQKHGLI